VKRGNSAPNRANVVMGAGDAHELHAAAGRDKRYWKSDHFRAQLMKNSTLEAMAGMLWSFVSNPIPDRLWPRHTPGRRKDHDKNDHFDQGKELELVEHDRPGIKKDRFNVEEDEKNGDTVKLDGEALGSEAFRRVAAFKRHLLVMPPFW